MNCPLYFKSIFHAMNCPLYCYRLHYALVICIEDLMACHHNSSNVSKHAGYLFGKIKQKMKKWLENSDITEMSHHTNFLNKRPWLLFIRLYRQSHRINQDRICHFFCPLKQHLFAALCYCKYRNRSTELGDRFTSHAAPDPF